MGTDARSTVPPEGGLVMFSAPPIARLASDGLSNPEISTQLFLSPRTVEWHLRKVFVKLGIGPRKQLRGALPEAGRPPMSTWLAPARARGPWAGQDNWEPVGSQVEGQVAARL